MYVPLCMLFYPTHHFPNPATSSLPPPIPPHAPSQHTIHQLLLLPTVLLQFDVWSYVCDALPSVWRVALYSVFV